MALSRRTFLYLTASTAALPVTSRAVRAQAYPERPVRVIVGFAPGGANDIVARVIGQWLTERLGQPFIIENRPGAAGNIGTEAVVRAAPDGHTLLVADGAAAINATLYDNLNFNFIRDIAPVAAIMRVPFVMVVNPSLPAKNLQEFVANAKSGSGKVSMASPGNGTPSHISGELFKMMAGIDMVHVPYRGAAPAITDLMGGQVQVLFAAVPGVIGHIRANKLRALAVTGAARLELLPDIPTVAEIIPGFEASLWLGLAAPKNVPADVVATLNREINAALADVTIKARLAELGGVPMAMTPNTFASLVDDETKKWAKVVRFAGLKAG